VVPDAFARGRHLYAQQCALCHGDTGQGYVADNANALSNPEFLDVATSQFLREAIIHGRPGTVMAALGTAWQGPLSDTDVDAIVAFIETWRKRPTAPQDLKVYGGDPARAEPFYVAQCQQCHGVRGQNGQYSSIANPRFLASVSDGHLAYALRHGRSGTPMPAFGPDRLDDQALADLVSLIRSWAEPVEAPASTDFEADPARDVINAGGPRPTFKLREKRFVAAADVKAAIDAGKKVMILDARARADYLAGHIAGSISVPFFEMDAIIEKLPRDTWIITYCGCPHAVSGKAFDALKAAKFDYAAVLDEGYFFWRDHDFGVRVGPPPRD
jgi:cytochrome c oxidase cbb3-type subunit 3/ubiquinol-cytochrome c reductase cytochrome c subunit